MNKYRLYILVIVLLVALSGCVAPPANDESSEPVAETASIAPPYIPPSVETPEPTPEEIYVSSGVPEKNLEEMQYGCTQMSLLYQEIYVNAEKELSPYFGSDDVLTQETIDAIEDILIGAGYPVINSDSKYPDYLANADGIHAFWESIKIGQDDEAAFWRVSSSGGLVYRALQFSGGKAYCIIGSTTWTESGALNLDYAQKREIFNWDMTFSGDFYFQDIHTDRHWDAAKLLRLSPVDKELYDWNLKCILPIGHQNINTFLCDWNSKDYGELSFNDMYGNLYKMENNEYAYTKDYESSESPYYHCRIPAQTFENTVFSYFDISLTDFRKRASYNEAEDIYPWQDIDAGNIYYFPSLTPEITEARENGDGSLTLCVTVMCLDMRTDCLFKHEVTIMPQDNGKFKYLSNQVTYRSENELPSSSPRIPAQRTAD